MIYTDKELRQARANIEEAVEKARAEGLTHLSVDLARLQRWGKMLSQAKHPEPNSGEKK